MKQFSRPARTAALSPLAAPSAKLTVHAPAWSAVVSVTLAIGLSLFAAESRSQDKTAGKPAAATPAATPAANPPAANPPAANSQSGKPALTVTTVRPSSSDWPMKLAANGNIAPWQEAMVGAEVNGLRLSDVKVNVGDLVKKGQVLAVFDVESVQADIALVKATLAEAQAALAEAQSNAERARQLQNTGAISAQQIGQYLTAEQTARARIASAQAQLRQQNLRLKHTRVLAPDDGVISTRSAMIGAVSAPGMELFRMVRQSRLEWRAEVTANEIERVRNAKSVMVTIGNSAPIVGTVRTVAPTSDPLTRNTIVYVDLPKDKLAKSGMFARGEFELGASPALAVPQQSVVVKDGFSYVFRIGPDNRVMQTRVQTGRRSGELLEITSGLSGEAVLVASGAGFLNDGDLVGISNPTAKASK